MLEACAAIHAYTIGETETSYRESRFIRSAVQREFSIIGEAMVQLLKQRPELVDRISNAQSICRFRNILVHAYDLVDHGIMWKTVVDDVPVLQQEVEKIMRDDRVN